MLYSFDLIMNLVQGTVEPHLCIQAVWISSWNLTFEQIASLKSWRHVFLCLDGYPLNNQLRSAVAMIQNWQGCFRMIATSDFQHLSIRDFLKQMQTETIGLFLYLSKQRGFLHKPVARIWGLIVHCNDCCVVCTRAGYSCPIGVGVGVLATNRYAAVPRLWSWTYVLRLFSPCEFPESSLLSSCFALVSSASLFFFVLFSGFLDILT